MRSFAFLLVSLGLMACGGGVVDNLVSSSKSFDAYDAVRVVSETGRIQLSEGSGDGIELTAFQGDTNDSWQDREEDGVLVIEGLCSDDTVGCTAIFELIVPAGTHADLSTTEGAIDLVGGLRGMLEVQTASGAISGSQLGAASFDCLTNATVNLDFADTPASVFVNGGRDDVKVALPAGAYALSLDAPGTISVDDAIEDSPSGPPVTLECAGSITVESNG